MATIIRIRCDGCGRTDPEEFVNKGNEINLTVRPSLANAGWKSKPNQSKDYCPTCVALGRMPSRRTLKVRK